MAGKSKTKMKNPTRRVQFESQASEAQKVSIAGDFNNWDASANLMKKDKKGIWKTNLSLKPGKYKYRFLKDGNWENDPSYSNCVTNEFGSQNCLKVVE